MAHFSDRARELCERPVFIIGAPRSGTTWLQMLLLADGRVVGGQESHFWVTFGRVLADFDRKGSMPRKHGLACYWRRGELVDALRDLWLRTMAPIAGDAGDAARWLLEKTPDHALAVEHIVDVLPGARFIHMVRDSRAVCASLLAAGKADWGRDWAARSARDAARRWNRFNRGAIESLSKLPGDRWMRVRYERMHEDPVAELTPAWRWLGLDVDAAGLERLVRSQAIENQGMADGVSEGATGGMRIAGDVGASPGGTAPEPAGFFRQGRPDAWKTELGPARRWLIWRMTKDLMRELGYRKDGTRTHSAEGGPE